jgi:hypothetical protein
VRKLASLVAELVEDQQHVERRRLAADDRRVGVVLLPLIDEVVLDRRFTGPLLYQAALGTRTAAGQALAAVLADYGSMRAVGKLLARLSGITFDGCRLAPAGRIGDDRAWVVDRVSGE